MLPGHNFLGPGTNLKRGRFALPRRELDWAAKLYNLDYENLYIKTEDADQSNEQRVLDYLEAWLECSSEQSIISGLNEYFRP